MRRRRSDQPGSGPSAIKIHVGAPRVRPQVVPAPDMEGRRATDKFRTSFIVVWHPLPLPPPIWIEFLRQAPFGSQSVRAGDLHWDGKFLSVVLSSESDIEAFAIKMGEWEDYANSEFLRYENPPAAQALKEAHKRALEIESRLRK